MNKPPDDPRGRFEEARSAVQKAREAMRENNRHEARQWAEHAATLAPQLEDPWLILAAVASPRASVEYIQKALKINPQSPRARRGMEWAMQRVRENPEPAAPPAGPAGKSSGVSSAEGAGVRPAKKSKRSPLFPILLFGLGCLICGAAAWSASGSPVLASIMHAPALASEATQPPSWAEVPIAKPTYTPSGPLQQPVFVEPAATQEVQPTAPAIAEADTPTPEPTQALVEPPTDTSAPTAEPTWSGTLTMQVLPDTPTSAVPPTAAAATSAPSSPGAASNGGQRWIDVNLTQQMVYAYEGDSVVNSFLVSTGTWQYPTVTGKYHIYVKLRYTDMSGPDYYLPNVPFTMYFYQGYGLHGTYWHHNFGTPMSHGCVNLSIPDSEWLYNFASVGTLVNIHY